jgi:hypothetical protein
VSLLFTDLSSGIPDERERVVASPPAVPLWSENLVFALYDPSRDIGFWLHLGTVPGDWTMWEDRVYAYLPHDEGVLSMWAYHRTPPERRPAGSNLAFECIEPWRRWRLTFDGFALPTSDDEMAEGLARQGRLQRLGLDLEIECATPAWDYQGPVDARSTDDMSDQSWAKEHYEQLYRARGRVRLESGELEVDACGWRDHSRGPRGGDGAPWGGHVIMGCLYRDSGRAWGLARFWTPDGEITLARGYVVDDDGALQDAEVLDAPRLRRLVLRDEELPVRLRWPRGELDVTYTTRRSLWLSMQKELALGTDLEGPGLMYALNHGSCHWDGEVGEVYSERSDMLNAFPDVLRATAG